MRESYKSFMEQQQPSQQLVQNSISKVKTLSEEESGEHSHERKISLQHTVKWKHGLAIVVLLCLICAGVWKSNTQITYIDLVQEFAPDEEGNYVEKREKEFGDERNQYLKNYDETYLYVFDKDAITEEISVGAGRIIVQIGTVEIAGNQLLYQVEPQIICGQEVFFGKTTIEGKETLLAAFDIGSEHYYLTGVNVTEKEMTSFVKGKLKASKTE